MINQWNHMFDPLWHNVGKEVQLPILNFQFFWAWGRLHQSSHFYPVMKRWGDFFTRLNQFLQRGARKIAKLVYNSNN
jgi:hypothetical protein